MKRIVIVLIIVIAVAVTFLFVLFGHDRNDDSIADDLSAAGIKIGRGDITSSTGLEFSKKLNERDGGYVDLYVENKGPGLVAATINGQNERTLQPGENGHIFLEVTQNFLGFDREYEFKVVSAANGGSISIYYEITQGTYDQIKDPCLSAEVLFHSMAKSGRLSRR